MAETPTAGDAFRKGLASLWLWVLLTAVHVVLLFLCGTIGAWAYAIYASLWAGPTIVYWVWLDYRNRYEGRYDA